MGTERIGYVRVLAVVGHVSERHKGFNLLSFLIINCKNSTEYAKHGLLEFFQRKVSVIRDLLTDQRVVQLHRVPLVLKAIINLTISKPLLIFFAEKEREIRVIGRQRLHEGLVH